MTHDAVPSRAQAQTEIEDLPSRRLGDPSIGSPPPSSASSTPARAARYGDGAVIACDGLVRIYKQSRSSRSSRSRASTCSSTAAR